MPTWNIRREFIEHREMLSDPEFRRRFSPWMANGPIESPYMTWYGLPDPFLTLVLQRAILGLEAYVSVAVYMEAGARVESLSELARFIRNPFDLGGRGTADTYYNR